MAGPDLKSRFHEPSAPESLDPGGEQEMNPISWCPLLRETGRDSTITKPTRYDDFSFAGATAESAALGGVGRERRHDNMAGWCIYTHRRMIPRYHNYCVWDGRR